jgi:hypothetical protein
MAQKDNASKSKSDNRSKEEFARRIAGNISTKNVDEIQYREDARRRATVHTEFAAERVKADNPYRQDGADSRKGKKTSDKSKSANGKKSANAKSGAKRRKKKKKNGQKAALIALVVLILILAAGGACGWMWYSNGKAQYDGIFLDNTYINGTNVSGKTPEEAAVLITQDSDMPDVITLTKSDGTDVNIKLSDVGLEDNIAESVQDCYSQQDHSSWYTAKTETSEYNFKVKYDFDRDKLYSEINRRIVEGQESTEAVDAYIQRTSDGFEIVPEVDGTGIDEDKVQTLYDYIDGFLDRGEYSINLTNCDCYQRASVTEIDLKDELTKLNSLYSVEFTFDFTYTTDTLKGSEVIDWITFENDDPTAGYTVDEDKAMAYVEELADKYDTYKKDRTFVSTSRGEITLEQGSGDYGWWIDQEKTCALLVDMIEEGISAKTEPIYYTNPDSQYKYTCNPDVRTAESDIGDTYIEIDLKEQHFWYYENGELEYECDIVSGKPTTARNTPAGVYKLWYKELDKVLSGTNSDGESWSTPVTYWNNISTIGVGLHDATWQTSFGGTRYVNYGSHGCINMPLEAAKYVYENVELNTPVIMYW